MDASSTVGRFNWRLPLYGILGAVVLFLPITIWAYNIGEVLYLFIGIPIISLVVLAVAIFTKRKLAVLSMLIFYWAVSWVSVKNSFEVHTMARWLLWSKSYKAELLAQPEPSGNELRHIEWDGWGLGGNDTSVYLVYDPNNVLETEVKKHSSGQFSGIPCKVPRVFRIEKNWYSVVFYTPTVWNDCGDSVHPRAPMPTQP
jgi:hypothetical protein